jgi:hypothetical protein
MLLPAEFLGIRAGESCHTPISSAELLDEAGTVPTRFEAIPSG